MTRCCRIRIPFGDIVVSGDATESAARSPATGPRICPVAPSFFLISFFGHVALSSDASESAARLPATESKLRPVTPSFFLISFFGHVALSSE